MRALRAAMAVALCLAVACTKSVQMPVARLPDLAAVTMQSVDSRTSVELRGDGGRVVVRPSTSISFDLRQGTRSRRVFTHVGALAIHPAGLVLGGTLMQPSDLSNVELELRDVGGTVGAILAPSLGALILLCVLAAVFPYEGLRRY